MSVEGGGPIPPKQEIISSTDKEPQQPRKTKIKPWHRVTATVAILGAAGAGILGLRAFAGGGDPEVRPQTSASQSSEPSPSSEVEQMPTLENLIGETQTEIANKSIDLLKAHPEDVTQKTDKGFIMKITSGESASGDKTEYGLVVEGNEKNGSYDPTDISSVNFTIINTQKNAPESERLLYSALSKTGSTAEDKTLIITYKDFNELPFSGDMDNTYHGRTAVEKMKEQIGTLYTSASGEQQLGEVERPY